MPKNAHPALYHAQNNPTGRAPRIPHSVTISLFEAAGDPKKFPVQVGEEAFRFTTPALAIHRLPLKYTAGGVRQSWNGPLLMRAFVKIQLPEGEHELLVRSPGLSRLWIDGSQVTQTAPRRLFPDAHQPFIVYQPDLPWLRVPFVGDREVRVQFRATGNVQQVVLESLVGSEKSRCEVGETLVAARPVDAVQIPPDSPFTPNHRRQQFRGSVAQPVHVQVVDTGWC
jgi:hypothetical protein